MTDARERILVVDDDADVRRLSVLRLRDAYEMVEAESGAEALERVAKGGIDLVLLDVMMPALSGLEVCRQLKSAQGDGFLPVLLLTALDDQANRNAGLGAGADDYLSKPIDGVELKLRVAHLLKLRAQDRLIRSQVAELKQLTELRDDLTSLIVHDLRNPLVGVLGALELVRSSPDLSSDDRTMVALGFDSAVRVRELTEDLLRIRMLEDKGLVAAKADAELGEVVADALRTVAPAAQSAHVELRQHGAPTMAKVDRKLMLRLLENLLVNAIRYTHGSVDVTVSSDATQVVLEVADRGEGVPDGAKPELFEKYGSAKARATGGARVGHGIGLYLVKLVATAHGGSINVRDREGGGAAFRVALPR